MRLDESKLGGILDHTSLSDVGPDNHHAGPTGVTISNTTQVISPGSDFNLDIALGKTGLVFGRVHLEGPATLGGGGWKECASIHVTQDTGSAIGHSQRDTGSAGQCYSVTYAKAVGTTNLTHKIFDSAAAGRYIALKDAVITGSILRLTFHNYDGSARTLSVRGQALLW